MARAERLHDMHCHLDFMSNGETVADDAIRAGSLLFANTVTVAGYRDAAKRFAGFENVRVGVGTHPWWAGRKDAGFDPSWGFDIDAFERAATGARFIGEVGLDFGAKHESTRKEQLDAFMLIANICARQGMKVMSIHAVRAAEEVLDILEHTAALHTCTCIFHWYSGPSDQLKRARDAGCYFSVNPMMAKTARGREYIKAIPAGRLLLETDAPPGEGVPYSYAELCAQLEEAAAVVASIKGEEALEVIEATSRALLER